MRVFIGLIFVFFFVPVLSYAEVSSAIIQSAEYSVQMIKAALNLSEDQVTAMRSITEDHMVKQDELSQKLRSQGITDRAVWISREEQLRQEVMQQYKQVLTSDQYNALVRLEPAPEKDAFPKEVIRAISIAAENYALIHSGHYPLDSAYNSGHYPLDITDLLNASLLNRNYCGSTVSDYTFTCNFDSDGYTIQATPVSAGTIYTISTGGVLKP